MLFPTIQFAVFFLLVLVASWLLMPFPVRWKPFILEQWNAGRRNSRGLLRALRQLNVTQPASTRAVLH